MPRNDPQMAVFFTCVVSHVSLLPTLLQLYRRRWMFEVSATCFGLLCSFLYHTCQAFDMVIFLTELQWHRLDNVGALVCFSALFTYLCALRDSTMDAYIKYGCFMFGIIIQEKSPWEIEYTLVPVFLFALMPVISHACLFQRLPHYDWKNFVVGFGTLVAAFPFFVAGLDDEHDPYRMFHGMWHLMGGVASLYLWRIVKQPVATATQAGERLFFD